MATQRLSVNITWRCLLKSTAKVSSRYLHPGIINLPLRVVVTTDRQPGGSMSRGRCLLAWWKWFRAYGKHPGTAEKRALCFNPSLKSADFEERFVGNSSSCWDKKLWVFTMEFLPCLYCVLPVFCIKENYKR